MDTKKTIPQIRVKPVSQSEIICSAIGSRLKSHLAVGSREDTQNFLAPLARKEKKAE